MINPKFAPIVFLLTILLFFPIWVQADDDDEFRLKKKLRNLQNQIDAIQLTPGPKGDSCTINGTIVSCEDGTTSDVRGPQGEQGPPGADGINGTNGTNCSISGSIVTCGTDISDVRGPQGADGADGTSIQAETCPEGSFVQSVDANGQITCAPVITQTLCPCFTLAELNQNLQNFGPFLPALDEAGAVARCDVDPPSIIRQTFCSTSTEPFKIIGGRTDKCETIENVEINMRSVSIEVGRGTNEFNDFCSLLARDHTDESPAPFTFTVRDLTIEQLDACATLGLQWARTNLISCD